MSVFVTEGSVLLQDDSSSIRNREHAINMDVDDQQRYQQQLQLIDEQVRTGQQVSPPHCSILTVGTVSLSFLLSHLSSACHKSNETIAENTGKIFPVGYCCN